MAKRTDVDKLRSMCDSERLRAEAALEILDGWEDIREWADALATIADYVDQAYTEIEDYRDEEDREAKRDHKDAALTSLEGLLSAITDFEALHPLPELGETPFVEQAS